MWPNVRIMEISKYSKHPFGGGADVRITGVLNSEVEEAHVSISYC